MTDLTFRQIERLLGNRPHAAHLQRIAWHAVTDDPAATLERRAQALLLLLAETNVVTLRHSDLKGLRRLVLYPDHEPPSDDEPGPFDSPAPEPMLPSTPRTRRKQARQ